MTVSIALKVHPATSTDDVTLFHQHADKGSLADALPENKIIADEYNAWVTRIKAMAEAQRALCTLVGVAPDTSAIAHLQSVLYDGAIAVSGIPKTAAGFADDLNHAFQMAVQGLTDGLTTSAAGSASHFFMQQAGLLNGITGFSAGTLLGLSSDGTLKLFAQGKHPPTGFMKTATQALYAAGGRVMADGISILFDANGELCVPPGAPLVGSVLSGIVANPSQAQGTPVLTADFNFVDTVSTNGNSVTLDIAIAGTTRYVIHRGASLLQVFPGVGGTIDGGAANAAVNMPAGGIHIFINKDGTAWESSVDNTFDSILARVLGAADDVVPSITLTDGDGSTVFAAWSYATAVNQLIHSTVKADLVTPGARIFVLGEQDLTQIGINQIPAGAMFDIDQDGAAAAISTLKLRQDDVSEPFLETVPPADADGVVVRHAVTGSPEIGWDESEDRWTLNKGLLSPNDDIIAGTDPSVNGNTGAAIQAGASLELRDNAESATKSVLLTIGSAGNSATLNRPLNTTTVRASDASSSAKLIMTTGVGGNADLETRSGGLVRMRDFQAAVTMVEADTGANGNVTLRAKGTGVVNIVSDLDHDGTNLGLFGVAPAPRAAAYTITNVTPDRAYDANTVAIPELADVLGTLIADLTLYGLLQ